MTSFNLEKTLEHLGLQESLRSKNLFHYCVLTPYTPISQNGRTHSNNSSLSVFDHFTGLALKGLRNILICSSLPRKIFNKHKITH